MEALITHEDCNGIVMNLLIERNNRETYPFSRLVMDYVLVFKEYNRTQNALYQVGSVQNLETEHVNRELRIRLDELSQELLETHRIINRKSEYILSVKDGFLETQSHSIELERRVANLESQNQSLETLNSSLEKELYDLIRYNQEQDEELESLRSIQESQRTQLYEIKLQNKSLIDQILDLKNQQIESLNELNRMSGLLKGVQVENKELEDISITDSNGPRDHSSPFSLSAASFVSSLPNEVYSDWKAHDGYISCLRFDSSGRRIVSGGEDRVVRIWNVATQSLTNELEGVGNTIIDVAVSYDGSLCLAAGSDPKIHLWSLKRNKLTLKLPGHLSKVTSAVFTPDSKFIVSGSYDRTIRLWDLKRDGSCKSSFSCVSSCNNLCLSKDGNMIISGHLDKHVRIWDKRSSDIIHDIHNVHTKSIICIKFTRVGNLALVLSKDSSFSVLDIRMLKVVRKLSHTNYRYSGNSWSEFGISPEGKYVAVGSASGDIHTWDIETGHYKQKLESFDEVTSLDWNVSGLNFASAHRNGKIALWN